MRSLLATLPLALLTAQARLRSLCDGPGRPLAPSRDLYCIELIAAPRIVGASGRVELLPAHREEILMLDDLLLNDDGLVPFGADAANATTATPRRTSSV